MLISKKNRREVYKFLFKGAWRGEGWAGRGGGRASAARGAPRLRSPKKRRPLVSLLPAVIADRNQT